MFLLTAGRRPACYKRPMMSPRRLVFLLAIPLAALVILLVMLKRMVPHADYDRSVCAQPPLRTVEARNAAMEAGYEIDRRYDCITKASFAAIEQERRAHAAAQGRASAPAVAPADAEPTLAEARRGFRTALVLPPDTGSPLPEPPPQLFVRSEYRNALNDALPVFVTPDPKDGRRHPAILWLTGGNPNSMGDVWTPQPPANDQTASAFREAGAVLMFATLRGGNGRGAAREYFFGEVDDVLAAAQRLAQLPYVDPAQIYLGGHSTGGTLALLAAEVGGPFKAVFAFGPVGEVDRYGDPAVDFRRLPEQELRLRSPIHWTSGIAMPTYLIEGRGTPGNIDELEAICRRNRNPLLHCIPVAGANHFSVLAPVTKAIAARIVVGVPGAQEILRPDEFGR